MAHILKEFSKHCGVEVGEPVLTKHFFPIKHKKYITIDTSSSNQACQYPYWKECVEMLREAMPEDVAIVRLGLPTDSRFFGEDLALAMLSVKQCNYLISNSMAHICVGGYSQHVASAYKVPMVTMFSNNMPEYIGPVWSDNYVALKAEYKNGKPSFAAEETEPVIFSIYPDRIINGLHKIAPDIFKKSPHRVDYVGPLFHHTLYEVKPDFFYPIQELDGKLLNIRMDFHHDETHLEKWLQTNRCSLITNKEISIDLLRKYRRHIPFINFFCKIGSYPSEDYLRQLEKAGIRFKLYSDAPDSDLLREEINKYFDFPFERIKRPEKWPEKAREATHFKSNKILVSKDGFFLSKSHMEKKDRSNKIIKSLDFLEELDHFYLYGN